MFGYVTAIWSPRSRVQRRLAASVGRCMRTDNLDWSRVFTAPGIAVYCTGIRPGSTEVYPLHDQAGVVLGTVFSTADIARKALFGAAETARLLQTRGRSLADECWGRYVAFAACDSEPSFLVMRSPTGELDCLSTVIRGVRVYFSATERCPPLTLRKFSINWDYIAADLATLVPDTRETGLREIERVLRGECLHIRQERVQRLSHWNPLQFVNEPICDARFATLELRRRTQACVHAWASCYRNIVPMLSGGLDSSIVVGLLREVRPQPKVVCINYYNRYDAVSDERRYARAVARRAGYELIEREQPPTVSLEPILRMPKTISPCLSVYGIGEVEARAEFARARHAQAWFLGHGGDEIFSKSAGDYICADFVRQYGPRPQVLSIALQAARMTHRALWPALRDGIRDGLRSDWLTPVLRDYAFLPLLRPDVIESVRRKELFIPSWLRDCEPIAPGKCLQIIGLAVTDMMHSSYAPDDDPEVVNPLKSQPLQELCLSIPTHVLALGGTSRGLARMAFADDLPREVARRRAKATVQDYIKEIWISNRRLISDVLLDGLLTSEGIVDETRLRKSLSGSLTADLTDIARAASLACAEVWARQWTAPSSVPAASRFNNPCTDTSAQSVGIGD
jgi:asparagine synthase (glutamine-hydrolysing)